MTGLLISLVLFSVICFLVWRLSYLGDEREYLLGRIKTTEDMVAIRNESVKSLTETNNDLNERLNALVAENTRLLRAIDDVVQTLKGAEIDG